MGGDWRDNAACLGKPLEWFDANPEAMLPDPRAKAVCDTCQVVPECMKAAQDGDEEGCWAGTSYWQRRQLKRRYRRSYCPVCRELGGVLIEVDGGQVCLTCAVSWRATPARQAGPSSSRRSPASPASSGR